VTDSCKIFKGFLAPPGDLQNEHGAAKAFVDEFNGYHVELVGWEHTIPDYRRPAVKTLRR
jgi:hypothetical protein